MTESLPGVPIFALNLCFMRLLLPLFLISFTSALSAQVRQFVWAPSGLSLRVADSTGAERIAIIPYGAQVAYTGIPGRHQPLPVLPAYRWKVPGELDGSGYLSSQPLVLHDRFLRVKFGDSEGYAYGAYLLPYPPPATSGNPGLGSWLRRIHGEPVDVREWDEEGPEHRVETFAGGMVWYKDFSDMEQSITLSVPGLRLSQATVLADRLYDLFAGVRAGEKSEEYEDFFYSQVETDERSFVHFYAQQTTSIRLAGGFAVISVSAHY